jgi:large subunit ribosomal protein L15
MNVGKLDQMVAGLPTQEGKYFMDLEALGYSKLLGTGKVTKPLTVKVASCSKPASQKIKDAGGEVLVETEEKGE